MEVNMLNEQILVSKLNYLLRQITAFRKPLIQEIG